MQVVMNPKLNKLPTADTSLIDINSAETRIAYGSQFKQINPSEKITFMSATSD